MRRPLLAISQNASLGKYASRLSKGKLRKIKLLSWENSTGIYLSVKKKRNSSSNSP